MNKGVIIGIIAIIIIGISALVVSGNSSDSIDEISLDKDVSEVSVDENIVNKPKEFTVGLDESVGFTEGG